MSDRARGLFRKFIVTRTDGTSEAGQKHDGCEYFVLDMTHDPYAKAAASAYVDACKADYPMLAADMVRDFKLRADALAPAEPGWQPIDTAPKDGTHVVLFGTLWNDPDQRPRACVSWWCTSRKDSPAYALGWFFSAPGYTNGFNPTAWMPLPAPPRADAREAPPSDPRLWDTITQAVSTHQSAETFATCAHPTCLWLRSLRGAEALAPPEPPAQAPTDDEEKASRVDGSTLVGGLDLPRKPPTGYQ